MTRRAVGLSVLLATVAGAASAHAAAEAVATFHSIGITWSGSGGAADVVCNVRYRAQGSSDWKNGFPLWYDARAVGSGTPASRPAGEYRGSLVHLTPGTTYEIELSLQGRPVKTTLTAKTWSETFPVGNVNVVKDASTTLRITKSGSPTAYELYAPAPGGTATIDVANAHDNDVYIDASYVIVRGLTLKGARRNAIDLGPNAHDVVIELNDISGFGRISTSDGAGTLWGSASDAALYCNNHRTVERIVFQRNRVHHPRADSNNWDEPRPSRGGNPHPLGPQAVTFETCGGNHVFRYNEIYSDADHYFQDGIGGGDNFSFEGFPRNDSDIYGNKISQCWDDGIEAEGGNRNVRIWGNYIDHTYVKIAVASISIGPTYVFRNVANVSRRSGATAPSVVDGEDRGPFLKAGSRDATYRGGRVYVFHNTLLQPVDPKYTYPLGCGAGIADSGGTLLSFVSRNNVFHIHKSHWASISDDGASSTNDFNFDLYNGRIEASAGQEAKGIKGVPKYFAGNPPGVFALDPTSPGFDVGERLPGFNDDYQGAGPDMGAFEHGGKRLEWGIDAGLSDPPTDAGSDAGPTTDAGGTTESGVEPDAATNGGDLGPREEAAGGCGCRSAPSTGTPHWALAAIALVASRTVRRARRG